MRNHLAALVSAVISTFHTSDGTSQLISADVVDGACYSLTGETTSAGKALFTITFTRDAFKTVYETSNYNLAKRTYAKMLRGNFPVGEAVA